MYAGPWAAQKSNNPFLKVDGFGSINYLWMWSFHPSWPIKMFLCRTPNTQLVPDIFYECTKYTEREKKKTSTGKHPTSFVFFSFLVCPIGLLEM